MADYDYKAGKQRLEEILDNDMEVVEQDKLPNDDDFTFTNGYYSWVSAIFVDMRDSTELCADEDKEKLAKVFRSFSSEIIEILRDDDNLREIGMRGIVYMQCILIQSRRMYMKLQISVFM